MNIPVVSIPKVDHDNLVRSTSIESFYSGSYGSLFSFEWHKNMVRPSKDLRHISKMHLEHSGNLEHVWLTLPSKPQARAIQWGHRTRNFGGMHRLFKGI